MRFAYADPPYFGCALSHYGDATYDNPEAHRQLIARLCEEYPDGWALSLNTPTLRMMLSMCPDDVRIGAWVKPFAVFKPNVNPAYAWEPVIYRGGRKRTREEVTARDWHSESITLKRGLKGAKPKKFAHWIFYELLGAHIDDEMHDLFPGTGAIRRGLEQLQLRAVPPDAHQGTGP